MASQQTKFAVGLFLSCGMLISVVALVWLGMSHFLEKGNYYATYFDESVQGLEVDAPVKYRGVSIGRVASIRVAPDDRLIQVVMKIESGQTLGRDIVAQLKVVGITGTMFLELDQKRKNEPDLTPPLTFPSEHPIVASRPSGISKLMQGLDDIIDQMRSLDIAGISDKVKLTLDNMNQLMADTEIKKISAQIQGSLEGLDHVLGGERLGNIMISVEEAGRTLNALLDEAGQTLDGVKGVITVNRTNIDKTFEDLRRAMETANAFLEKGSSLVGTTDQTVTYLRQNLLVTSQNLEKASDNLNRIIEILGDQPSQLLFGEPPPPRKVDGAVFGD
jgi:phospholipid/cholesterol/gamma-HCH transport system substrate-binding protein